MRIPHFRYWIAGLLFFATLLNYADRLMLSVVAPQLRRQFSLTESDYATVVALFMSAYAIMYALSGPLTDRLGTRRALAIYVTLWSAASMAHALTVGKWSLGAWRFILGLAEPGNWPAAAKAVAEWFPREQRALGVGIFNAGSSMGSMLAPPVVAWITLAYGWRAAFFFTGSLGLVWVVLWLVFYQPPHRSRFVTASEYAYLAPRVQPPQETAPSRTSLREWVGLLKQPGCYPLLLARFFTDPVIYFLSFWLPEYLQKERGFDLAMVGRYAWVPFLFGDIGYLTGGWVSGRLLRRGWPLAKARGALLLAAACLTPCAIFAPRVPGAGAAIALTCAVTFAHALWISNLLTLPTDLFPASRVGAVSGWTGMGGAIGGVLANLATGWVVQRFSYAPVFAVAGLVHPLGFLIVHFLLLRRLPR